jgi:hypothetical protein
MKGDPFDFDVADQHAASEVFSGGNRLPLGIVSVPVDHETVRRSLEAINFGRLFQDPYEFTTAIVGSEADHAFDGRRDK